MNIVDRCRLLYLLKSVAIRRIHHINAKMCASELGRDGNSFPVWTPKGLLIVAILGNASGSRTIWLQGPDLKQTAPVIGGEREHAAIRRPPRLTTLTGPVCDLPQLGSVRPHGPDVDRVATFFREECDAVARRPCWSKTPEVWVRDQVNSAVAPIKHVNGVLTAAVRAEAQASAVPV